MLYDAYLWELSLRLSLSPLSSVLRLVSVFCSEQRWVQCCKQEHASCQIWTLYPTTSRQRRYVRKDSGYDTRCVKVAAFSRESYSLKVTISFDCCIISALPQTHGLATCPSSLAPYVGCRRVVFLPKRRHSVSCRRHVVDMFQSCRRHDQMSCWPGCPKRHDMSAVPDMSVKCLVLWHEIQLKHTQFVLYTG